MGLDQWAFRVKNKAVLNRFEYNQDYEHKQFFYWRKNRYVHNWMEKLYQSLGGKDEFNLKILQLLPEDIDKLEEDTKSGKIKEYNKSGVFLETSHLNIRNMTQSCVFVEWLGKNLRKTMQYSMKVGIDYV